MPDRLCGGFVGCAALALAPKCLVCVLAYAGLGAALGLGGPELCGAPTADRSATASLAGLGAAVGFALVLAWRNRRLSRTHAVETTVHQEKT